MVELSKRERLFAGLEDTASVIDATLKERELRLGGEQREITVAFADIRGFTTLADCLQPQELVIVLNTYLSTIIKVFFKYGVMINKLGGDSVMAVWNAPRDCEEHALVATVAAFEAQRAIGALQKRELTLPKIGFGIGINTGKVIAGNIGCEDSLEYSVIGDTVNVAAKLTRFAPGGEVWITADTFELVKDHISAKALGPLAVKGKRQPVKTYEVLDIHPKWQAGDINQDATQFSISSERISASVEE